MDNLERDKFEVVGDLWLKCQEGGFASDAFVLQDSSIPENFGIQLVEIVTNLHPRGKELDDLVAEHFGCVRQSPSGDSHYWNRLPNGAEVDLTSGQFEGGDGMAPVFEGGEVYRRVLKRYERLKNRVLENLE